MQNQSLLKSIDTLLVSHGLAGLNDVQMVVLASTLAGESYPAIADRSTYTVEYLREVGAKLWQILSSAFGESVSKKNIKSVLQRYQQSLAAEDLERQYAWGEAIDVSIFYGRTTELKTLEQWITKDRCRLIAILAMGGMGKTALAVKLAQQLPTEFDFVVWRSLRNAPPLTDILAETIALLSRQQEIAVAVDSSTHIERLLHYLRSQRCLLILDNVESILLSGSPRQYLDGYEGYRELFQQLAECSHQSCVLLTSREQVAEVVNVAGNSLPVRILPLGGLSIEAGMAILEDKGLPLTIDKGQELIDLYAGNPLALKIISTSILDIFDGQVTDFFEQGIAVFNGIRMLLERQFDRLSPVEQQVMFWLAINREWVSVGELQADVWPAVSASQLLEALEYLQGRSLIEVKGGRFTQQPVVMEYAIDKLLRAIRAEIGSQAPRLFLNFALMKAQAKDYVRDSQIRVIVQPLLMMLASDLGGEGSIIKILKQILARFEVGSFAAGSYGAGNCLNLLNQLAADLTGLDLAGLSIRQADLREVPLPQVNLAQANLATSLFAESIGDIFKVALSPDDRLIAKGGSDGKIVIWNVDNGQNILNIKAHDSHVVGLVFTADSKRLISSSFDQTIKIWDLDNGSCLKSWQLSAPVYRIALSPDNLILASGSNSGDVLLWDMTTGQLLKNLTGHTMTVVDISFQPQGKLLASGSFDTSIKIWDLDTGDCVHTLTEHTQIVSSVNFNASGTQLVSSGVDTSIKVWDVGTGICLQTICAHSRIVIDALFSPHSQQIISGSQDLTIRIWDEVKPNEWDCSHVLQGHEHTIWSIALNSTDKVLVTSDQSGILKLWDVASGHCLKTFSGITKAFRSLAFHPQANLLASSSDDRHIHLWDLSTYQCSSTMKAHQMAVWQVAFSPSGDSIASCGLDGAVKLWDITANLDLKGLPRIIQKSPGLIFTTAFHPHTEMLATGGIDAICLWNYRTGELLSRIEQKEIGDLAFHPTGKLLASASHNPAIKIWDVETGECQQTFLGHSSENWTVAFHPQGQLLASGGEDNSVRLWDLDSGECRYVLKEHNATISCVAFSPDGSHLASASKDYTVRIWEVATGKCLRVLTNHTDLVNFVVFHPEQKRQLLASCSHDETIRLWDTDFWLCTKTLRPQRIYEDMNITEATGLTPTQLNNLKNLGAITS